MLREEIKQLKTGSRDLRKFGIVVGGVFLLLGVWFWHRQTTHHPYLLVPGVLLVVAGAVWPRSLKQIYIAWMSLALLLGLIVSTVLLTVFFYVVITLVSLIARLAGKDFLNRTLRPDLKTYWIKKVNPKRPPASYEQQF